MYASGTAEYATDGKINRPQDVDSAYLHVRYHRNM